MTFFYKGKKITTPVTTSVIDDSAMLVESRRNSLGKVLALIGEADSGEPLAVTTLYDPQDGIDLLGISNTELFKAIEKSLNPSLETLAPERILFVRVNPDTQAEGYLKDASGEANAILVKSVAYGVSGATVTVAVGDGTQLNTKKVTVSKFVNGINNSNFADNLSANLLSVSYIVGPATLAVSDTQLTINTGTAVNIPFSTYQTIQDLATRLNAIPDVTAIVLNNSGMFPATALDALAETDLTPEGPLIATAITQMVTDVLNTQFSSVVIAEKQTTGPITALANTTLAGLSLSYTPSSATTLDDWQSAFDVIKEHDCLMVVPLSDIADVAHMATAHCDYMSLVAKLERYTILGMAAGTTNDAAIAFAKTLNHKRAAVVHQGFYDNNINNVRTFYPPYVLAALLGGMFCGVSPGTALTNKAINVLGMERRLRNPEETDVLLAGGVLCCWPDYSNTTKVLQSITTAQTANFAHREMSVGIVQDAITRALRTVLDPLRGKKGSPYLKEEAYSRGETLLNSLIITETNPDGWIVGDAKNPAWKDLVITQGVDFITATVKCSPVIPCNYIGIEVITSPYLGTTA